MENNFGYSIHQSVYHFIYFVLFVTNSFLLQPKSATIDLDYALLSNFSVTFDLSCRVKLQYLPPFLAELALIIPFFIILDILQHRNMLKSLKEARKLHNLLHFGEARLGLRSQF